MCGAGLTRVRGHENRQRVGSSDPLLEQMPVRRSRGLSVGATASPSEQRSGFEELKGGQDGPDPLEVRIASPEPGGRVDSRNGDLDIGESDGMAALA